MKNRFKRGQLAATGHAGNMVIAQQATITCLQGDDLLAVYKLPGFERFYNS